MPRYDGNGPAGMGPRTGWGRGPCGAGRGFNRGFGGGFGSRRFWTKSEEKESLQEEKESLENEMKAIKERLDELKNK